MTAGGDRSSIAPSAPATGSAPDLCAPIIEGETILGTLNLGRCSDHASFDPRTLENATEVGRAIGARLADLAAEPSLQAAEQANSGLRGG